jgi:hypothetical protein
VAPTSLGFSSDAEAQTAVLTKHEPLEVGYIHAGNSTCSAYSNCPGCLMFFYRGGQDDEDSPRGGVVVDNQSSFWPVVKFAGDRTLKELVSAIRDSEPLPTIRARRLLIVPELRLRFVEVVKSGQTVFAPLGKIPHFNPKKTYTMDQITKTLREDFPMLPSPLH